VIVAVNVAGIVAGNAAVSAGSVAVTVAGSVSMSASSCTYPPPCNHSLDICVLCVAVIVAVLQ